MLSWKRRPEDRGDSDEILGSRGRLPWRKTSIRRAEEQLRLGMGSLEGQKWEAWEVREAGQDRHQGQRKRGHSRGSGGGPRHRSLFEPGHEARQIGRPVGHRSRCLHKGITKGFDRDSPPLFVYRFFFRVFRLSWETSTLKSYHPEDSKRSGSRRIEFFEFHRLLHFSSGSFSRESTHLNGV